MRIADAMKEVHATAREKGWWEDCEGEKYIVGKGDVEPTFDPTKRNVGETFLLMQSEISEAFEEYRNGKAPDEIYYGVGNKPEGIPIELADCCIRIFDWCEANGIDLETALRIKMNYNKTRPHRHGGKKC